MSNRSAQPLSTGLPSLDYVLKGFLPGDNVVWQVDAIEEYQALVTPYARAALRNEKTLLYFRFARHQPLLSAADGVKLLELDPEQGFENFIASIHGAIEENGHGAFYVFDCLSRLAADWCSDQMLANFFMLTCPYLYDLETIAYFALYRNYHTSHALGPIQETTQLFLDTYRHKDKLYVRPVKVQQRYSPTMNMLHVWEGNDFRPVTASAVISEILNSTQWSSLASDSTVGFWETSFLRARELIESGEYRPDDPDHGKAIYDMLVKMIISRDPAIQQLISRYIPLQDILNVRRRMIGTGLIGGKTVGMLLSRAIVKKADARFEERLEEHDSFYVGSDVFYDFLVRCGIWWLRQRQRNPETFLDGAERARRRILTGTFPDHILQQFEEMLDYFGQSPFIVRSSSLLEDNYGHSFAGKYESVYCANQGPREQRMEDLLAAIRTIYASSMSEKALRYRADRGMLDRDEQMALLIMRVSGAMYGKNFYPHMAGVGFSFNPYAWAPEIDPNAGVIRLVFGLGTRAVNRSDDDYTRVVALNAPLKRPETNFDEVAQYAQHRVDYLDLEANQLVSDPFTNVVQGDEGFPLEMFATEDTGAPGNNAEPHRVLTFDALLQKTDFVKDLHEILRVIESAYHHPVDIEFTANFVDDHQYKISLLQCRPLQVQGATVTELPEVDVNPERIIIAARGAVIGQSRINTIDRMVYVSPDRYGRLPLQQRYEVARVLGKINRAQTPDIQNVMLLGPGRWGTASPHLGIPVSFSEIHHAAILCEIVAMHENLVPDVSLGTHFLNELVERNVLYLALFPQQGDNRLHRDFFEQADNRLLDLIPEAEPLQDVVRVIDTAHLMDITAVKLVADAIRQQVHCYIEQD